MDLVRIPASQIVTVAQCASENTDVDVLCFGESDQRSPVRARDAMIDSINAGHTRYADVRGTPVLRQALETYLTSLHGRTIDQSRIQVTGSGMAAIGTALCAMVRPGDKVLVHTPVWPNLPNAALLRGAEIVEFPMTPRPDGGFTLDLNRLEEALPGKRVFILNSPNNPTGWTATRSEMEAILVLCRKYGVWLLSDEVYARLTFDGSRASPSMLDIAEPDDRLVVCNSFSKTWAMTGWRVGWMVTPRNTLEVFTNIVEVGHSGVAPFAQAGAAEALQDEDFLIRFREHCAQGRQLTLEALADLPGVHIAPPVAAFYAWLKVDGLQDSLGLAMALVRDHKVAVAPGAAFAQSGEGCLRVCFAQSAPMLDRALARLRNGLRDFNKKQMLRSF